MGAGWGRGRSSGTGSAPLSVAARPSHPAGHPQGLLTGLYSIATMPVVHPNLPKPTHPSPTQAEIAEVQGELAEQRRALEAAEAELRELKDRVAAAKDAGGWHLGGLLPRACAVASARARRWPLQSCCGRAVRASACVRGCQGFHAPSNRAAPPHRAAPPRAVAKHKRGISARRAAVEDLQAKRRQALLWHCCLCWACRLGWQAGLAAAPCSASACLPSSALPELPTSVP